MADTTPGLDIARLVSEHHAELYRYAYRLTGRQPDAEDLTQQTFLQAHSHLHQVREAAAVRGWLFSILRHCWHKSCRTQLRGPREAAEFDIESIPAERDETPVDQEQLQTALDELPESFRSVLLMYYFEECSYKEIAERIDLPIGTVMSRLSRAKGHLRKRLFAADKTQWAAAEDQPEPVTSARRGE